MANNYNLLVLLGLVALGLGATDVRPSITCNPLYTSTQSCQNFARVCLNELNDQVRMELTASYTYQAMSAYYDRDDVAYRGFAKFFSAMADEEREHAKKLQDYIVQRGGRVHYKSIPAVATEWQTPLHGLREALNLEKRVNSQLLDLHWMAQQKNDPHLQDYLEGEFLTEQVESAKKLSDWIGVMGRMEGDAVGWTLFDEELYSGSRS